MSNWEENDEINRLREYLRIPSVYPKDNYESCVAFIIKQAEDLGLPYKVIRPGGEDQPIVIITWLGTNPDLPSIMLNSHMDVVSVFSENWSHPPFAAEMDSEGRIFARGIQDMKSIGMQYLAAIRALRKTGVTLKRTIHVIFVPDEESGGKRGMDKLIRTEEFKKLNIGFALDEGRASPDEAFSVSNSERSMWRLHLKISGPTGHALLLHPNTAGEKLNFLLQKIMALRQEQVNIMKNNKDLTNADVMTINLTRVEGGVQTNIVPPLILAVFDVRIPHTIDHDELERKIRTWCEEAGGGVEIYFELKEPKAAPTELDSSNIYWMAFKSTFEELGLKLKILTTKGGTDSRYLRQIGIPALGFGPMNLTPTLLHAHDEFLKADTYLKGIEIYKALITNIANA